MKINFEEWIYSSFKKNSDINHLVTRKRVNCLLGKLLHMPQDMRISLIKFYMDEGYLEKYNREYYKLLK